MMSVKKYASSRGLPISLVTRLVKDRQIPATKLYTRWYVDEDGADEALKDKCKENVKDLRINTALSALKAMALAEV